MSGAIEKIKKAKLLFLSFLVALALILSAHITILPANSSALGSGWANPLVPLPFISAGYLANGCGVPGYGDYLPGRYHIADDYGAAAGADVYSIGHGTVTEVQVGWPGKALFIIYPSGTGGSFMAVYGHIVSPLTRGTVVRPGQIIGQVYNDGANSHLHFGIRDTRFPAPTNNGAMPCSRFPDNNGYVDPIPFLTSRGPPRPPAPPAPAQPPPPPQSAPPPPAPPQTSAVRGVDCSEATDERAKSVPERLGIVSPCRVLLR